MLRAIISGKAGRIVLDGVEHRVSWREVFRRSEDLLTAAIFSRVRYLSPELLSSFMAQLVEPEVAASLGPLDRVDFWSNLEGTHGRVRVQPDLMMWFAHALVIVEVKPPFGGDQYIDQWQAQVHAVVHLATKGEVSVPERVHFVGLGQNKFSIDQEALESFKTEGKFDLSLHKVEWSHLTAVMPVLRNEATGSDAAVLDDWISAIELFGMVTPAFTWSSLASWAQKLNLNTGDLVALGVKSLATSDKAPLTWDALIQFSFKYPLDFHS